MSQYLSQDVNKVTTMILQRMRNEGEKISMLTAYDYSMAKLLDLAKNIMLMQYNVFEGKMLYLGIRGP